MQELDQLLADYLGVSPAAANAYLSLFSPKGCKEFRGSVAISIQDLLEYGLVTSSVDRSGDTHFFPVCPTHSLSALLLREMWREDEALHAFEDLHRSDGHSKLKKRYNLLRLILSGLHDSELSETSLTNEIVFVTNDSSMSAAYLSMLIADAKQSIISVNSPPNLLGEAVWNALRCQMDKGVDYSRITEFEEIARHGIKIYGNEAARTGESLYVLRGSRLPQKFYVFDDVKAAFFIPLANREGAFSERVQIIVNEGVAGQFRSDYSTLLKCSTPALELLPALEKYRSVFMENAKNLIGVDEYRWLQEIFDYGVFSTLEQKDIFVKTCLEAGLVRLTEDGKAVANYSEKDLRVYE